MKFFVVFAALATLATASLLGGRTFGSEDDGTLTITDIGKRIIISKPSRIISGLQENTPWMNRLDLQRLTPNMDGMEVTSDSRMDLMPWWMMSKRTPMINMMLHKTPSMINMDSPWARLELQRTTPNIDNMDVTSEIDPRMNLIPWWTMSKKTPMINMMLHKTPSMIKLDSPWARLELQRTTPNIDSMEVTPEIDPRMNVMPWWVMSKRTPMINMMLHRTPSMLNLDSMTGRLQGLRENTLLANRLGLQRMDGEEDISDMDLMPWRMMSKKTSMVNMIMHKTPNMINLNSMGLNKINKHMIMNPMMFERMTPMMPLEDISPMDINTGGRFMTMDPDWPMDDVEVVNNGMTTRNNFWNNLKAQRMIEDVLSN